MSGSYTVEASFVMTVLLLVLAALLCQGLILHDRAVVQAIAVQTVFGEEGQVETTERIARDSALSEETIRMRQEEYERYGKRCVSFYMVQENPLTVFLRRFLPEESGQTSGKVIFDSENPVKFLRLLRQFRKLREEETS